MLGEALTIAAAICWAVGASLYRKSLFSVRPITLNLFRSLSAAVYAFLVLYLLGKWDLLFKLDALSIFYIAVSSLLVLVVGDTLYFISLKWTGVSRTLPIADSYPILVTAISVIFLGELITHFIISGTIAILLGIWLIDGKTEIEISEHRYLKYGTLAAFGTMACWGCGVSIFKLILMKTDPFILLSVRMIFLLPVLGLLTAFRSPKVEMNLTKSDVFTILLSGLVAVGLGDTFLYLGLKLTNLNIGAPLTSTTPFFADIIAILFLKEKVSRKVIAGTFFVVVGVILLTFSSSIT